MSSLNIKSSQSTELGRLLNGAKDFATHAKSRNTRRAYRADWARFTEWCEGCAVTPLPAEPGVVASYVVHLTELNRKPSSISRALVAISQAHKLAGHESPTTSSAVRETLKGYKRKVGTAQKQKTPVNLEHLLTMLIVLPDRLIGVRDKAILLLGFAGGFRRSELVGLNMEDLRFERRGVAVTLRRSKTDQEGQGRRVGIPVGRAPVTCPVDALREWIHKGDIVSGPVFRPIDKGGKVIDARLTAHSVARIIKRTVERAGYDPAEFSGHSLRAGLATAAAEAGKSERVIMATTGHKSEKMVRRYIREGSLFSSCASEGLL
ncbi:MAG: site-specific integrase [Proteobacteria bacterium]|nr:site-specific integrase [Pseudomonadota bacterium]